MNLVPLLGQFWENFGISFGPQIGSKIGPIITIARSFLEQFFGVFEALEVPLGSLAEPLMIVLGASKT